MDTGTLPFKGRDSMMRTEIAERPQSKSSEISWGRLSSDQTICLSRKSWESVAHPLGWAKHAWVYRQGCRLLRHPEWLMLKLMSLRHRSYVTR